LQIEAQTFRNLKCLTVEMDHATGRCHCDVATNPPHPALALAAAFDLCHVLKGMPTLSMLTGTPGHPGLRDIRPLGHKTATVSRTAQPSYTLG